MQSVVQRDAAEFSGRCVWDAIATSPISNKGLTRMNVTRDVPPQLLYTCRGSSLCEDLF